MHCNFDTNKLFIL